MDDVKIVPVRGGWEFGEEAVGVVCICVAVCYSVRDSGRGWVFDCVLGISTRGSCWSGCVQLHCRVHKFVDWLWGYSMRWLWELRDSS